MTLLHLRTRIDALLGEGKRPGQIARILSGDVERELDLGFLPGEVGFLGELLDGPVAYAVIFFIAQGRKHRLAQQAAPRPHA